MFKEKQFKEEFRSSVREYGGYDLPLSGASFVGLPDMYIIMPQSCPLMLEAKWMGEIKHSKFKRKIPYTGAQRRHLIQINNRLAPPHLVAFGLIGLIYEHIIYAVLLNPEIEHITNDFKKYADAWAPYQPSMKRFNIEELFSCSMIPWLQDQPKN